MMKRSGIFLFIFSIASITFAQTRQVYDKSLFDAKLDQFETYTIGSMADDLSDDILVSENQLLNNMVENAIAYEMDVYNYDQQEDKADLLINYMIFDQAYNDKVGYMPGFRIDEDFGMDNNILDDLKNGSLMVSVVRTEDGKAVWSGFVTDGIDTKASLQEQQKDARQVVSAVMESFMANVNFEDIPTSSVDAATGGE